MVLYYYMNKINVNGSISYYLFQAALPQGIVPFVFAKEYNVHPDILSTGILMTRHLMSWMLHFSLGSNNKGLILFTLNFQGDIGVAAQLTRMLHKCNTMTHCIETSNKVVILKAHKDYVPICMEVGELGILMTGNLMSWMLHFSLGSNSKAITSLKEQVIALQELDHSVEILICVLCTIPCWSEKNVQVQHVIEVLSHIASIATKFPNKCVILFIAGIIFNQVQGILSKKNNKDENLEYL
ncbi:protein MOR1 [Artemisia annua]|uniref:Protein MOR1 n=1 Tax=Artemisia annua TaxID=35608 RepID=A0A2U1M1X1_ARTAN|nr:protein MOR1 [Artemisia annua]